MCGPGSNTSIHSGFACSLLFYTSLMVSLLKLLFQTIRLFRAHSKSSNLFMVVIMKEYMFQQGRLVISTGRGVS